MNGALFVLFVLAFLPLFIRVNRERKAGSAPVKIAAEAIPALYFPVLLAAVLIPLSSVVRSVLFAIAALLAAWDILVDVVRWRRSKAAAPRE